MMLIPWFGTVVLAISDLPQLKKTIETKEVTGLSVYMLRLKLLGIACFLIYSIEILDYPMIANFSLGFLSLSALNILFWKYNKM